MENIHTLQQQMDTQTSHHNPTLQLTVKVKHYQYLWYQNDKPEST